MDKLKMGNLELTGSVHFTTCRVAGESVPALEVRVEGPVDQAMLEAMEQGSLEIYGQDGLLQGTHKGYGKVVRHSVLLAKVTDAQQELAYTREELEALRAEKDLLEGQHAALLYTSLTGEVL